MIGILPHTGAGSIFGGKNRKVEAPGLSLFPAPCKLITKAPKDSRREVRHYNKDPHLDVKARVCILPSPFPLSEFPTQPSESKTRSQHSFARGM